MPDAVTRVSEAADLLILEAEAVTEKLKKAVKDLRVVLVPDEPKDMK